MTMQTFETRKLLEILKLLAPATDETTTEQINACVIFDGETISTDDGFFRIQVEHPTAISFKVLLTRFRDVVQALRAEKIDLYLNKTGDSKVLAIHDGGKKKSRIVIACVEDEPEHKDVKKSKNDDKIYLSSEFARAIEKMKVNANLDGQHPERRGVHLQFTQDKMSIGTYCEGLFWMMDVDAYATQARNKITVDERSGILMPWVVSALAKLYERTGKETATLTFHGKYMNFAFAAGDNLPAIQVLCSPLVDEKPHESETFDEAFTGAIKQYKPGTYFKLPEKFNETVALAKASMTTMDLSKDLELTVLEEGFKVKKKTHYCETTEDPFPGDHKCKPYEGRLRHDRLEIILPYTEKVTFSKGGPMFFQGKGNRAFLMVPIKGE